MEANLRLAESLGGRVAHLAGRSTAETLLTYARERAITRILVGRPDTPRWRVHLSGSLVDELVRSPLRVELVGTMGEPTRQSKALPRAASARSWLMDGGAGLALVIGATVAARVGTAVLSDADVVMLYLLAVLIAAFRRGQRAAVLATALSVAAFNFFFVPPFHTFAVAETRNLLTFAVLLGVGLAASTLADRLRRQESDAVAREQRTAALLSLTRATASAVDEAAVARAIVAEAAGRIAAGAALLLSEAARRSTAVAEAGQPGDAAAEREVAHLVEARRAAVERPNLLAVPVIEADEPLAVLVLRSPSPGSGDLADAYARQTALALTRVRHAAAAEAASLRARTEELRSALLSTVSHDLRTPLAAITGAATALLDGEALIAPAARTELLTSVRDEAARLERLVANLLEMTRLSSGPIPLHREWVPLDEVVGGAFARVETTLVDHPITTALEPDLPLLKLDPVLFEHVLVNLLENAARHTPPGTPIRVSGRRVPEGVELTVTDAGPGFPPGDLARLFEPFVRGAPGKVPGSGLGLAICRGIVLAHGATIRAERRAGGGEGGGPPSPLGAQGASVTVVLPTHGTPPTVPIDKEEAP